MPARHILASTTVSLSPHGKLAKSPFEAKSPYNPIKSGGAPHPGDLPLGGAAPPKVPHPSRQCTFPSDDRRDDEGVAEPRKVAPIFF